MSEARLVEGPNVFRDAVANGVLVKKGHPTPCQWQAPDFRPRRRYSAVGD